MADRLEQRVRDAAPRPLAPPDAQAVWTRGRRLRRRRRLTTAVVSVLAVLVVGAAGVLAVGALDADRPEVVIAEDEQPEPPVPGPEPEEPAPDPGTDDDRDLTEEEAVRETRPVTVFFARLDHRIWVEPEVHHIDAATEAPAREAMAILVSGDTRNPDLGTLAPAEATVLATNIRDRVLVVDVSEGLRARGGASMEEGALAQQLAHTAAAFDGIDAVQLYIEGAPIDELWGHFDWSEPIEPAGLSLSPITITEPGYGDAVLAGEVTVSGEATVFEGEFHIRLYGPDGWVLEEDRVIATTGGPARGTWEHTFTITAPGRYTIEAEEQDIAPDEGLPPFVTRSVLEVGDR
jgi:hypothetical protein